ncbi:MAG: GNAT family N-acetyltransferase [Ramlibacter sp.]|nr:GNAT family N-acetyltransferase [Ramlibacter sp.]
MAPHEVTLAMDWAAAEGWNPGLNDAPCFHAADAGGFLVGLLHDQPVATISVVRYGKAHGFLGLYIVRADHRGRGLGLELWNAGLDRLHGCAVGLDGVVAQQDNYRRSGFAMAWRNARYQGTGGQAAPVDPGLVSLSSLPFEQVAAYDQPLFGAPRPSFLQPWIAQPGCTALGMVDNGELKGYGVLRPCRQGFKIGPLFADNESVAERLFVALQARVPEGDAVYLDVPGLNPGATALARRHGMTPVFETARMYTGTAPPLPLPRIFGITTFELG